MHQEKDIFDTIDDYFSNINGDEIAKKITKTVNDFSDNLASSIEDSMKNSGYDSFGEFVEGEIKDNKGKKPQFTNMMKEYTSRYDYVKDALNNVNYEIKYRGYFKEGHMQALNDVSSLLTTYSKDLDALFHKIKEQIQEIRIHKSQYKKAYYDGYIAGCEYAQKAIKRSKQVMMKKVLDEIHN